MKKLPMPTNPTCKPRLVLIVGVMKGGSTSLFHALSMHPDICASINKEVGYFAFEEVWAMGNEWYEQHFFEAGRGCVFLEASTDYAKYPFVTGVQDRISAYDGHVKILMILRNPLRRIESHARHVAYSRREIGSYTSPRSIHSLDDGISEVSLAISKYAMQLRQYKKFLEQGDMMVVFLEEFNQNTAKTMNKVHEFLGLSSHDFQSFPNKNSSSEKFVEQRQLWRFLSRIDSLKAIAKNLVPKLIVNKLREISVRQVEIPGRFELTEYEKEAIIRELGPDLKALRDEFGLDWEQWWDLKCFGG